MPRRTIDLNRTESSNLIQKFSRIFLNEATVFSSVFDDIEQGYDYLAGNQLEPKRREWLKRLERPTRTFNLIFPAFNAVVGDFLMQDQKAKVYKREGGSEFIASILGDMIEHVNISNESDDFLMDTALAGLVKTGFFYPRFSTEREHEGSIVVTNEDEMQQMYDSRCRTYLHDDAQYQIRSQWLPKNSILHHWSQHRSKLQESLHDLEDASFFENMSDGQQSLMRNAEFANEANAQYRIVEVRMLEWEGVPVWIHPQGNSQIMTLEGRKRDLFLAANPGGRILQMRDKVKRIFTFIPALDFALSYQYAPLQDRTHDLVPFSAYNYGKTTIGNFGIMKNAIPIQDHFNDEKNVNLDLLNKNANPGALIKREAFHNPTDMANFGRRPGVTGFVKSEFTISDVYETIDFSKAANLSSVTSDQAADLFQRVTGLTPNLQGGTQTTQENASLFAQRVKQATQAFKIIYRNWQKSKQRLYSKVIKLAQMNYTAAKTFYVSDNYQQQTSERQVDINTSPINDITVGKYQAVTADIDKNPTMAAIRFLQKTELAILIMNNFGPGAVDPRWWLADSDLGDMELMIKRIEQAVQAQAQAAEATEAMEGAANILTLAKQKLEIDSAGGGLGNGSPQSAAVAA